MEGFHVNEFCHKIERKSLNPTTVYFNNSAESQELFNNDHHPVKWHKWHIANTTISMINTTIWDIVISTTHRNIIKVLSTPINLDWIQLQLDFDTLLVEWELDICLVVKVINLRMNHPPLPKSHLHTGHQKQSLEN